MAKPLLTGKLSDAEKAEARRLHAEGLSPHQIADKLRRRTGTIIMMLAPKGGRPKKEMPEAPGADERRKGEASGAQAAASEAANTEMLGGDRGGLQRHSPAEHDPVQAEDAASVLPTPSSAEAPASVALPSPRPLWWREIHATLNALGHKAPWTPALDLALVEGLVAGNPLPVLADDLGVKVGQAKARFIAMTPDEVDRRGQRSVTVEHQLRMIEVLRYRAGVA